MKQEIITPTTVNDKTGYFLKIDDKFFLMLNFAKLLNEVLQCLDMTQGIENGNQNLHRKIAENQTY